MTLNIPDRVFYRIKEVCNLTGLKPHVLRYWEQEFKDIKPLKSSRGQRLYKRKDLEIIFTIKNLLYEKRFTIDGAKKYMSSHKHLLDQIRDDLLGSCEDIAKGRMIMKKSIFASNFGFLFVCLRPWACVLC